jgi:DNA-directed RNA polymerase specialized sigma24 family protein
MATLSEADQEVLRLAVYEELSHTEVAAAMGARPALVRTALFRARRRLEQATIKLSRQRIRSSGHVHRDRPVDEGNKERPQ